MMEFICWLSFIKIVSQAVKRLEKIVMKMILIKKIIIIVKIVIIEKNCSN